MGGYSIDLFLNQELHKEFLCIICHDVLKDPTMSLNCEHIYCSSCITDWTATSNTCPIDRATISGLRAPFRAFMNLYNDIELKCGFDGCSTVSTIGEIESHISSCEHNPEAIRRCPQDCGASVKMMELPNHNCITYMKNIISQLNKEKSVKESEVEKLNLVNRRLKQHMTRKDDEIKRLERELSKVKARESRRKMKIKKTKAKRMKMTDSKSFTSSSSSDTDSSTSDSDASVSVSSPSLPSDSDSDSEPERRAVIPPLQQARRSVHMTVPTTTPSGRRLGRN